MDDSQARLSSGKSRVVVWQRIVARSLAGLQRQRGALIVGVLLVASLAAYTAFAAPLAGPGAGGGSAASGTSCADATILAVANQTSSAVQKAYQCLEPSVQQGLTEQQFAARLLSSGAQGVTHVSRVGTYQEPDGSSLVYYALDSGQSSTGYIVYLGADGKVQKVV